jgi:asparagine synthase (glutamine-hydrolysing)
MCGICGFAGFSDRPLLEQMTSLLRHRGPDDDGFHIGPGVGLGCQRLSIIDLAGGHMPITNEDGSITVIQNGEIFNYRELQADLKGRGHTLRTQSDTEVLVHLYEEHGRDFCRALNGDFAIALWDERAQALVLARDRFGVHPLYYAQAGPEIAFASEIKSLLCWKKIDRALDLVSIDAYLALRYVPQNKTFFKQIHKLTPGCTLRFNKGKAEIQPYWQLPETPEPSPGSLRSAADELLAMLKDSVNLRLRADVPVGAYLSGGIDSSLVVALMRSINAGSIKTFSIGFGLDTDELSEARQTASDYRTDHHEIMIEPRDYELLPKIIWHLDEPIGDSIIIPSYRLSQAAARQVKVVTSGEGADEVWGGYIHQLTLGAMGTLDRCLPKGWSRFAGWIVRHLPTPVMNKVFPYPSALGRQGQEVFSQFLKDHANGNPCAEYLALASLYRSQDKNSAYTPEFASQLGSSNTLKSLLETCFRQYRSQFANALVCDMNHWLPNYTLLRQDKMGFANSLEVRVPFLDHRLVEFAMRQPDAYKVHALTTKRLLREAAARVLPKAVAKRRKKAFFFPVNKVFGKDFNQFTMDVLGSKRCRERGIFTSAFFEETLATVGTAELLQSKRVMALLILELWFQTFVDREGLQPLN